MSHIPVDPPVQQRPPEAHSYDLEALHSVKAENHNDKYPVEEIPAAYPPDTFKETVEAHEDDKKRRVCGLTSAQFWAIIIIILVVVAGAIGGGIGAGLSKKKSKAFTRTTTTTSASSTSTAFIPQNKTYAASALDATAKGDPIATLAGNVRFVLQNDNNFVVYNTTAGEGAWATLWKTNHTVADCGPVTDCTLAFGADGNLVNYVNGSAVWNAGTAGAGETLVFMNLEPWVLVLDGEEREVWRSWDGVVEG
ncbi:hypothetical protein SLS56_006369 [Neofusicoccum ribis]|uniref:Bulb-type lectin domain-containing protein n=1 Tax=Neofusicoccum ribis TaxID=45134 RepID=A0ABR3SQZ0_9PEZI